jgi:FixJ family two-component response regulator
LQKVAVISVVDDDASVRSAISGLVASLGYEACTFSSAEDFLNSDAAAKSSCIIADVQMPGMGGAELQRHLLGEGRRPPMIFITAFPEEKIRRQVLGLGAIAFLSKPFDAQALIQYIEDAVKAQGGH